jgi:hypothetical protein
MADKIKAGTILIKEGALLPESLRFESEPYSKGWRLVKNLDSRGLDRKIREAGWTFFYMADEVKATVIGTDSERTRRRAVKHLIVNMKADRFNQSNTFNCLEIAQVAVKRFLGLPYVTVSAHPRHIQESMFLFHSKRLAEWDRAKLAVAST